MSTERRKNNTLKRDQALNDATNGQLGEEPRQVPHLVHRNLNLIISQIHLEELLVKCLGIFDAIQYELTYFLMIRIVIIE